MLAFILFATILTFPMSAIAQEEGGADEDNEDYRLMITCHGTAFHVEKLISRYGRAKRLQDTEAANQQHAIH